MPFHPFRFPRHFDRTGHALAWGSTCLGLGTVLLPMLARGLS